MKQLIFILLSAFLLVMPVQARHHKKKEKVTTVNNNDSTKKTLDRIYPKIFKKKDNLMLAKHSDMSIFLYNKKVYLEFPVKNFGKEYFVSSTITSSNLPILVGAQANSAQTFVVERADTLLTFRRTKPNYRVNPNDSAVIKALDLAGKGAIFKTASIQAWNRDSTAVLVEATDFLSASNKDIFDLKGVSYDLGTSITGCSVKSSLSFMEAVFAYKRCVCLQQEVNGTLSLGGTMIGELSNKPSVQVSVQTLISLLPSANQQMMPRAANASVGTKYVKYKDYRNLENTKDGYYAVRRNYHVGDTITFYVDTLLSKTWIAAISRAVEGWNDSFEKAKLGRPIQLNSFPKDSTFSANDPMANVIKLANNSSQFISFDAPVDPRTGEILGTRIMIPRNLADDVRRYGVCKMAEVDERYRSYDLPDDLLCEVLQAKMLSALGYSLGLSANLAGSAAYSIQQLRSPQFTKENGITASVMDGQIYNYVAMPGDKEKGVVLTFNHPGVYDDFVIKYLYTPDVSDDVLKEWVKGHAGDVRYFCGKRSLKEALDPRCQKFDMSNDPFQAAKNMLHHYKFLAKHAPEWYDYSSLPDTYRQLFPEFVINDYFSLLQTLTPYIGGVYVNEYIDRKSEVVMTSVPKSLQRKAVKELLYELNDVSWLDANPLYFQSAGPSANVGGWVRRKEFAIQLPLVYRLPNMDMSISHSTTPYTQSDLIDDVTDFCFRSVKNGKAPSSDGMYDMFALVSYLTASSSFLTEVSKEKSGKSSALYESMAVEPAGEVIYGIHTDLGPIVLQKMRKIRPLLLKARHLCKTDIDKYKIDYIILAVDRILKK